MEGSQEKETQCVKDWVTCKLQEVIWQGWLVV